MIKIVKLFQYHLLLLQDPSPRVVNRRCQCNWVLRFDDHEEASGWVSREPPTSDMWPPTRNGMQDEGSLTFLEIVV